MAETSMSDPKAENTGAVEDRNPVDVLADEFAARLRAGESPSMQEYVDRHPEHADEIQELFPGVALLEQLSQKQDSEASFAERPRHGGLPPGYRFGDIELIREVGRGGMGIVYEGYQHSLNRTVAVKAMSGSAVHSGKQATRFQREAQAAAQLHHTNIVPVFGVGEQEGTSYYVMQLIRGLGLDEILTELVRKTHDRNPESTEEGTGSDPSFGSSLSARGFADVLVSGQLSNSSTRPVAGTSSVTLPSPPNPAEDPTVVYREQPDAQAPSELEHRAENRTEDRTGEIGTEETPQDFVRSSLVLKDELSATPSVRSSMVLRDELPEGESFVPPDVSVDGDVAEDPSLASLGSRYWRNIARVGLQIASGLNYAHTQGTLHRDIKPANILLDTDGIAWIADFGLAKLLQQEDVTKTGDVVGTLRYMAPEQFRGETDARSDLYSFGLTLYELVTLRPAYDDTDRQRLIAKKLTPHDPPHPRKYHRGIPKDLETIVLKCLAWEPDRRYRSAGALVADLQAFLEDRPIQARPISVIERFGRWCKRQPLVASLSTAVLVLLVTTVFLVGILWLRADKRAVRMQAVADEMTKLRNAAEEGEAAAEKGEAAAKRAADELEQVVGMQWQALDAIFTKFVPERFAGPVEAAVDDEESSLEAESTATVLSPQTAELLEGMLPLIDQIAEIQGSDARSLREAANANRRLGDLHLRLEQYDEAEKAYETAIDRYRQLEQLNGPTSETSLMLARIHNGQSVAQQHLWKRDEARESWNQSLAILKRLELDQTDPTVRFETASTHYLMGRHPRFSSSRGGGRSSSGRGGPPGGPLGGPPDRGGRGGRGGRGPGEQRENSSGRPRPEGQGGSRSTSASPDGRDQGRFESFRSVFGFGTASNRRNLQTAVDILEPLTGEYPAVPEYRFLLALCQIALGDRWRFRDEEDAPEVWLAKAIEILEELVEQHPEEPDFLYQLSEAYEQKFNEWKRHYMLIPLQGMLDHMPPTDLTDVSDVEIDLVEAVRLSTKLLQLQPNVPKYAEARVHLLFRLAEVYAAQGNLKQAREKLEEINDLRKTIRERFPRPEEERRRGFSGDLLMAWVHLQAEEYEAAQSLLQPAAERFDLDPWKGGRLGSYRVVFTLLADALEGMGEADKAAPYREHAERIMDQFKRNPRPDPRERGPADGRRVPPNR